MLYYFKFCLQATQSHILSHYNESHNRLSKVAVKLGRNIERSKPYFDARIQAKKVRTCSSHTPIQADAKGSKQDVIDPPLFYLMKRHTDTLRYQFSIRWNIHMWCAALWYHYKLIPLSSIILFRIISVGY